MSEELNQNPEVVNETTVVEPENKPEKLFTQAELNNFVEERIAREKKKYAKYADYDDLKTKSRIVAMSFCEPRSCRLQLSS